MVLARPELLAAKPHELERCLRFVYGTVGGDRDTVLRCPLLLARPLGQVLGPRYRWGAESGEWRSGEGDVGSGGRPAQNLSAAVGAPLWLSLPYWSAPGAN